MKLTCWRVTPKREEEIYENLTEKYGEDIPEKYMREAMAIRELRETLSLQTGAELPGLGEQVKHMQPILDFRVMKALKDG
jgi:hypothetical protein